MEHRFRLQDSWLGCNGVVSVAALVFTLVLAALAAMLTVLRRRAA